MIHDSQWMPEAKDSTKPYTKYAFLYMYTYEKI